MTINMMLAFGAIAGILIGILIPRHRIGCITLLVVPLAMVVYIGFWQAVHPENLRSTSALDFLFGPLWPSLGALPGFYITRGVRAWLAQRNSIDS
jgi:hypothetical protein